MTRRVYGGYYNYDMTYDAIGNLTSYAGWTYTWAQGRRLVKQVQDSKTVEYDYDASGLRVRKKYNSTISDYTWAGGKLVHLKAGSQDMHFFYDAEGMPAMMLYNQTPYLYVRNLQGDIIALVDTSGTTVVEYKYDPWGKREAVTGTLAASVGRYNPFRYRGYIFDEETMMYYLKDRYYYPELRRFISIDVFLGVMAKCLSHNAYAYCSNCSVTKSDVNGTEENNAVNWYLYARPETPPPLSPIPTPEVYLVAAPTPLEMPEDVKAAVDGAGFTPLDNYTYSSSYINGNLITVVFTKETPRSFGDKSKSLIDKDIILIGASVDLHWKLGDWYDAGKNIHNGIGGDFLNALDSAANNTVLSFAINVLSFISSLDLGGKLIRPHLLTTTKAPTITYKLINRRHEWDY